MSVYHYYNSCVNNSYNFIDTVILNRKIQYTLKPEYTAPMSNHAEYLSKFFRSELRKVTVRKVIKVLKSIKEPYDGLVGTGVSGITMGAIFSHLMKKDMVIVRKDENRHSYRDVENYNVGGRYVFIDDLMSSGDTYLRVRKALEKYNCKIIGYVLYNRNEPKFELWNP